MAHRQRDYELYEVDNFSPTNSPGTHAPEFFTPGSPEATRARFGYRAIPTRNDGLPSTVGSSVMSGERLERVKSREMQVLWGTKIHWFLPSSMVALLFLGLFGSLAHHWFYQSLDGKEARDQLTMVRCGTALAFFTKAMLVGSVVIAYRQRIWYTLRSKPLTLRGIDSLFAVVEDPTHFITGEIYTKAKLATAMAVVTWIIPLASVLSPASLTTGLTEIQSGNKTCNVSTIDFSAEDRNDWRNPRFRAGESLAFWNITPTYDAKASNTTVWYDQPSYNSVRLFTLTSMSHTFISMTTPCPGFNCTWSLGFDGPWYNCSLKTAAELDSATRLPSNNTYRSLAPEGSSMYFAENDVKEYARPQQDYLSNVSTGQGVFVNEPRLWLGWVSNTTSLENDTEKYNGRWKYHLERHLMQCELQKVHYDIKFSIKSNVQTNNITVTKGEAINPNDNTVVAPSHDMHDPYSTYREYAAFHALGQLTRAQVVGLITQDNWTEPPRTFSPVSQTKLVNPDTALAQADLKSAFEQYFEEIVISLLSEHFLGISFNKSVPCTMLRFQNNFRYQRSSLWAGYAASIAMALACIIVGGTSVRSNGITSDTTFSKIMVTTRNRTIDRLVEEYDGVCLGGDPFPKELEKTQFQFGVIDEISSQGSGLKHAAFGTTDEVIPILKGDSYARLSARGSHYQSSNSWVPKSVPNSPVNTRFSRPI